MTPTQFLEDAARLMDERAELRPVHPNGQRLEGLHFAGELLWHWVDPLGIAGSVPDYDALAHIVAAWSERVAAAGILIWRSTRGQWYWRGNEVADHLEAISEAVKATIES